MTSYLPAARSPLAAALERGRQGLIDGIVNGLAKFVGWFAGVIRFLQSGYIYHYAFAMIIGMLGLLTLYL
jgi:NADH-quinone oxidoreductase subunit L